MGVTAKCDLDRGVRRRTGGSVLANTFRLASQKQKPIVQNEDINTYQSILDSIIIQGATKHWNERTDHLHWFGKV